MLPTISLESSFITNYCSINYKISADEQPYIPLIKDINQKHIFDLFTLGLIQGYICPTILQTLLLRRKPNEL
ncbi:hypothetical protein GCM10023338_13170 [Wohlfahrtiimonas larvae]|uniref:Uncharacterized protein n=1 Tax=Wohlfahrtiimonas larvae TaxID=1157986 RepID=A0ABP9MRR6_9GAMM